MRRGLITLVMQFEEVKWRNGGRRKGVRTT